MAKAKMDRAELVRQLMSCSEGELREILCQVFQSRRPYPEEASYHRNCFFLGIATSELESESDEPERWRMYELHAVAYPELKIYSGDAGPDGFSQSGKCTGCGVSVRSNLKEGHCPICANPVSLT